MKDEEIDRLEEDLMHLPPYAEERRRMLQEVEQYQDPESWIYLQAQRVVTEVQKQVLPDIIIGRNEMIEQACRAAGWDSQYYKICISVLYRLQMGEPVWLEDVMLCQAIYFRDRRNGKGLHENCRRLGVENIDWLGATTRLLGLEEPDPEDEPASAPEASHQQMEVEVPAGESTVVTVQVHVRTA
ncbi:hypothetical protein NE634_13955 [Lacrimispora saccharolytica]|nr:hypothetical protein [Lacrimispora saccharolytica]